MPPTTVLQRCIKQSEGSRCWGSSGLPEHSHPYIYRARVGSPKAPSPSPIESEMVDHSSLNVSIMSVSSLLDPSAA